MAEAVQPIKLAYNPGIFEASTVEAARAVILTEEKEGVGTDVRWERETPYVLELIRQAIPLRRDSIVLDYGCGIGRMAKAMIEATGCSVIGVDISASMRRMARDYVASDRFFAVSPAECDLMIRAGARVDAAIAIWVLQHCFHPAEDIARIKAMLSPKGGFLVLNMETRAIPVVIQNGPQAGMHAWHQDDLDIMSLLTNAFEMVSLQKPDASRVPEMASEAQVYAMSLRRPA